tara:strand:- start:195 stop:368 length:174 start_codon:yes stop_codon:yes gene_type:complete
MTSTVLLIGIIVLIFLFIIGVYFFDRNMVKKIDLYEKRMEEKGILKRHFISKNKKNK